MKSGTVGANYRRKVAVIAGSTEGIALASAQLLVNEGAYVFITGTELVLTLSNGMRQMVDNNSTLRLVKAHRSCVLFIP